MVNHIVIAWVLVGGVAGCRSKCARGMDLTGKYTEFKDTMCKCKAGDATCAKHVEDDLAKWTVEQQDTVELDSNKMDPKEAEEMAKKLAPIQTEYAKCMTAAMTATTASNK